ncbi:transcript variant X1 [Nothobranchius furzeri]|uniref:Si:ch1073-443f11.2 n=1 Tax=Nothobranchius furzeri TaxID=105023 RepID=A0A8C6MKF9_NOTFU|nr:transcript variant X1 [Nothobranchius furzeri]
MDSKSTQQELQQQFNDVVSRLESKQFFQSDWDTAFFILFFIFFGTVLLLVLLVLIRCCCCCCCDGEKVNTLTDTSGSQSTFLGVNLQRSLDSPDPWSHTFSKSPDHLFSVFIPVSVNSFSSASPLRGRSLLPAPGT